MGSRGAQGSGNTHSFIDGIKLRLSDKLQPPKRISLPQEYENRLPEYIELILDLDYNFRREEEVIKSYQAEALKAQSERNDRAPSPVTANGPSRPAPPRPPPPKGPASSTSKDGSGVSMNPAFASVSYRPLEPQKATKQSAQSSATTNNSNFRVEDFEPNTHNPFDNLELKSLNDMEELQHVLAKDRESN